MLEIDPNFPHLLKLQDIESEVSGMSWGSFKEVLSDSLIECLGPIQVNQTQSFPTAGVLRWYKGFFFALCFSFLAEAI